MCVAVIGGMDRLERHYRKEAGKLGIELSVYSRLTNGMSAGIQNMDAVVIFTNKVSHSAKKQALSVARSNDIPVFMYHSCGLCTLRKCLKCLKDQ